MEEGTQADLGCRAGDPAAAVRLSQQLLALGADVTLRSRWTNMNALHYAAYFDVPDLVRVLLKGARPRGEREGRGLEGMGPRIRWGLEAGGGCLCCVLGAGRRCAGRWGDMKKAGQLSDGAELRSGLGREKGPGSEMMVVGWR